MYSVLKWYRALGSIAVLIDDVEGQLLQLAGTASLGWRCNNAKTRGVGGVLR